MVTFPVQPFFDERHAHPHGAIGDGTMVKMQPFQRFDRLVRWIDNNHQETLLPENAPSR